MNRACTILIAIAIATIHKHTATHFIDFAPYFQIRSTPTTPYRTRRCSTYIIYYFPIVYAIDDPGQASKEGTWESSGGPLCSWQNKAVGARRAVGRAGCGRSTSGRGGNAIVSIRSVRRDGGHPDEDSAPQISRGQQYVLDLQAQIVRIVRGFARKATFAMRFAR